jgi:hypothetical protein
VLAHVIYFTDGCLESRYSCHREAGYRFRRIWPAHERAMRRREFIGLLAGAAACPTTARAQQAAGRTARVGLLIANSQADSEQHVSRT